MATYNTYKQPGESFRVFPLSDWTELDVWLYIYAEQIPIVPLYLAADRPVVQRDGLLIMVDDERLPLEADEVPSSARCAFAPSAAIRSAGRWRQTRRRCPR